MPDHVQGSIYDLGYRRYEGVRLGRRSAIIALYTHGLRSAFGLGRRASAKIMPIGLVVLAFIPAVIQLGIAAIVTEEFEFYQAKDYYGYVQVLIALFAAAVAPELVGRDQRNRTLPLYFSRALKRSDYAVAKFAALGTAMLFLTFVPQMILFIGKALAGEDIDGYLRDEWREIPQITGSAILLCAYVSAIVLPIAAQTPRRAYATGAILGLFIITWIAGGIMTEISEGPGTGVGLFIAPFWVIRGFTLWFFDTGAGEFSPLTYADIPFFFYVVVALATIAFGWYLFLRRMQRVTT